MGVWFRGSGDINCTLEDVRRAFEDPGAVFVGVVGRIPGMTSVEIEEQGSDSVIIRTNEGLMTRSNVVQRNADERLVIEYDERYEARAKVTTRSHFTHEFIAHHAGVTHRFAISDVAASGLLGLLYRLFGKSKTGNVFLGAHKNYFETHFG